MNMPDRVEFYTKDGAFVADVESSMTPSVGDLICVKSAWYRVRSRNFAVDHTDTPEIKRMVCGCVLDELSTPSERKRYSS